MITSRWRFWLITVATVLGVVATFSLGRWQLNRAAEKLAIQDQRDKQGEQPRLDNAALMAFPPNPSKALYRPVRLQGHWIEDHTIFLDNRQMNAKPGLYVITPLKIEGYPDVVLVQRGWIARNFEDRTQLPRVMTPTGTVMVEGRIAPPPSKLYEMGGPDVGMIRQNLDLFLFSAETKLPLLPLSIQQVGAASEGLLREWPVVGNGVEKHYGYAFQWFALCALIALLYVWFQIVRRFFSSRRA